MKNMKNSIAGFKIVWKEQLESTNVYASQYLSEHKDYDKTVILASSQSSGRGQRDNKWESQAFKNITISLLLKPTFVEASQQFRISEIISLGVFDYLSDKLEFVSIKWPNDIYVGDRKISGILIEHLIMGPYVASSICGIGLNINQEVFKSDAPNPISMKQITGIDYHLETELGNLLSCINTRYMMLENGEEEQVRNDYHAALYRKSGFHMFEDKESVFEANIIGVNEIGQLVLKDKGSRFRVYNHKEISFLGK
jgi:BirA family biotin operon repressor/biotin-[acetyl-CoA-carboxylase] ligase